MKYLIPTLSLLTTFFLNAQNYDLNQSTCLGGSQLDINYGTIPLANGGSVLFGISNSSESGNKTVPNYGGQDGFIVMLDQQFNIVWQTSVGGNAEDYLFAGLQLSDGTLAFAGMSGSGATGNKTSENFGLEDAWFIRLDLTGNIIGDKVFGGTQSESFSGILEYSPGKVMLIGTSSSQPGGNKTGLNYGGSDIWTIKTDFNGTLISDKSFGGSGFDSGNGAIKSGERLFVYGDSFSPADGVKSEGNYGQNDFWILEIDTNLNLLQQKTLGSNGSEFPVCAITVPGGNLVFGGSSDGNISANKSESSFGLSDFWIIETDQNLNIIRDKTIGSDDEDFISDIILTPQGIFCMGSSSSSSNSIKSQSSLGMTDFWFVNLDQLWNVLGDKTIGSTGSEGSPKITRANSGFLEISGTSNGNSNNDKACDSYGMSDFWIVKMETTLGIKENDQAIVTLSPNPVSGIAQLSETDLAELSITNVAGQKVVASVDLKIGIIDTGNLSSGVYAVTGMTVDGRNFATRLVKL